MNTRSKVVASMLSGFALLALSCLTASAKVVCNDDGDCWHVQEEFAYPPDIHLKIYPDDWRWKEGEHFVWKEHHGRGYWHGGEWREF